MDLLESVSAGLGEGVLVDSSLESKVWHHIFL